MEDLLAGRPAGLVKLYRDLEKFARGLGKVEIVAKQRYVLFRTTRIFADLVFMRDALRLAVVLEQEQSSPLFFKIGRMSGRRIVHVARLGDAADLRAIKPHVRKAYEFAERE